MPASLNETIEGRMYIESAEDSRLHLLVPSGIGDVAWILSKFLPLSRKRKIKFWLPGDGSDQRRCGDYLEMFGLDYDYLDSMDTEWVWRRPGMPQLPKDAGWVSLNANKHLEAGKRIEDWYPMLPIEWPQSGVVGAHVPGPPYVVMFAGTRHYMGGQLSVDAWHGMVKTITAQMGRGYIRFVGAAKDVEFIRSIRAGHGLHGDIIDRPFEEALSTMKSTKCKAVVGVASGPLIVNIYEGHAPTLIAYPNHLTKMPGSFEPPDARWMSCKLDELPRYVNSGTVKRLIDNTDETT